MAEHSRLLSPSASALWIKCTAMPQAMIDVGIKDTGSVEADRGTLQHHYCEELFWGRLDYKSPVPADLTEGEWDEVVIAVQAAKYVLRDSSNAATVKTEERVAMGGWRDQCFGTCDILVYDPEEKRLTVLDYKFGRARVNCIYNPQLSVYALAAIEKLYPETRLVAMGVIQPKISHQATVFTTLVENLFKWDKEVLAPAQAAILAGKTEFVPGPHCGEKYCKVMKAGKCPALNQEADDVMDMFVDSNGVAKVIPAKNNMDFFLKLMAFEPVLAQLTKTAFAIATDMLMEGEAVPGFKLVEGKGKREWKDEKDAEEFLRKKGINKDQRYKQTLITAPQAETLLKKEGKLDTEKAMVAFKEHVDWKSGSAILVPESDPREPICVESVDDMIDDLFDLRIEQKEESVDDFIDSLFEENLDDLLK